MVVDGTYFFLHIPKTAGTSLSRYMEDFFDVDEAQPYGYQIEDIIKDVDNGRFFRFYQGHISLYESKKFLPDIDNLITVLRNPWVRVYSHFRHHSRCMPENKELSETYLCIDNLMCKMLSGLNPDDPLVSIEEHLYSAKMNIKECAFFGLTELFDESLAMLADKFGWMFVAKPQRFNSATKATTLKSIPEDKLEIIKEHNTADMELYVYANQLFEKRWQEFISLQGGVDSRYSLSWLNRVKKMERQGNFSWSAGEAMHGLGWLPRIHNGNNWLRWMGPNKTAFLNMSIDKNYSYTLRITCLDVQSERILNELQIAADGSPLDVSSYLSDGQVVFETQVPREIFDTNKYYVRLEFSVPELVWNEVVLSKIALALLRVDLFKLDVL